MRFPRLAEWSKRTPWRRRHRRLRILLGVAVLGYLAVALGRPTELFPFFSWKLFHLRAPDNLRFTLMLEEVRGLSVEPPQSMLDIRGPARILTSIDSRALVRKLGLALKDGEPSAAEYRKLLESAFLNRLKPIRYQVVAEKYDAASFVASRRVTWRQSLGSFELD